VELPIRFARGFAWLRRRDPALTSIRRGARVTLVACLGFYTCRYGLGNPTLATYALFGAVGMGVLAQIPGTPGQRARTLLAVLPVGCLLVTAGTLLSVSTWSAVAGMLFFGFLVSYAGVGGPRLTGLAAGVQLLYILPSFPPYDPGSLGYRLAGLTVAVVLLAVAERLLWPDPPPVPYAALLADALAATAGSLSALAAAFGGDEHGRDRTEERLTEANRAAEAARSYRLSPGQRPASAGRRDRALSQTGGLVRLILGDTIDLAPEVDRKSAHSQAVAALLRQVAAGAEAAARSLRGEAPPPRPEPVAEALDDFRRTRRHVVPDGEDADRLRAGSLALSIGEWTLATITTVRVARGAPVHLTPTPPADRPGPFWYAHRPAPLLWWQRYVDHLTPRSVYFQGALRLAVALAVARGVAGVLDLSHGFWVLLATLAVLRTSAAHTRSALRPVLIGTVVGSALAGGLLLVGASPQLYEALLPVVMLVGFTAGPLLGLGWSQALFTLVISLVFAQLAPVNWRLAEARVLDVAIGAVIGVLIGLVAWPRGSDGEMRRTMAGFLDAGAAVVRQTIAVLAASAPPGSALPEARRQGVLAEASYALYHGERHAPPRLDWPAVLHAGHHVVGGADALLLHSHAPAEPLPGHQRLTSYADAVGGGYERLATALLRPEQARTGPAPADPGGWPVDAGLDLYRLSDLRVWLDGLAQDLAAIGRSRS
jgi:uncharacterized membrane protein YccC